MVDGTSTSSSSCTIYIKSSFIRQQLPLYTAVEGDLRTLVLCRFSAALRVLLGAVADIGVAGLVRQHAAAAPGLPLPSQLVPARGTLGLVNTVGTAPGTSYSLFFLGLGRTITQYGSTVYRGIAMVVVFSPYIREMQFLLSVSSQCDLMTVQHRKCQNKCV